MKSRNRRIVGGLALTLVGLVLVILVWPRPPKLYRATILPTLGGDYTVAYAINDRGQVAGVSRLANGEEHLFLWDRASGMQDLGPAIFDLGEINNRGQIAATMHDPNNRNRAFLWDPNTGRHVLPTLGGDDAEASAVNNLGHVIGLADTASGWRHVFVWDPSHGIRDLTPSAAKPTRAYSINDAGHVLTFDESGPLLIGTRDGQMTPPPRPPLRSAHDINNGGAVVGLSRRLKNKVDVEVWHKDLGTSTVAQLKGAYPFAQKINDAGQVLFMYARQPGLALFGLKLLPIRIHNYLWDAGRGQIALDACVSLGRGDNLVLVDLNNHGALVGAVQRRSGRSEGVFLEPIPERWPK